MLPVMDILQSIPILGFFPFVLLFFVNGPLGDPFGIEVAAVFLIFTSMAWNMAFGVYESITTLPQDLDQAARSFGLHGWLRFRLLAFPAMVPKLIYNSILSWTNGWFFLVASEIITSPGTSYVRPGLGSFIYLAGQRGDIGGIAIGIAALATVVLLLDVFLWRPMSVWSERFRMETTATGERASLHVPSPYERLRWLPRFPRLRREVARRTQPLVDRYARSSAKLDRVYSSHQRVIRAVRRADIGLFLIIFVIVVATGLIGLVGFFQRPLPSEARGLPIAAAFSFLRLLLAYLSALAWTIPVAAWLGRSKWAARFVTPVFEISASIPATALQPLIIGFAVAVTMGGYFAGEIGAYLVSLFAMQWYLLFNLIAGVRSIPGDLDEAARSVGLREVDAPANHCRPRHAHLRAGPVRGASDPRGQSAGRDGLPVLCPVPVADGRSERRARLGGAARGSRETQDRREEVHRCGRVDRIRERIPSRAQRRHEAKGRHRTRPHDRAAPSVHG